MIRFLAVTFASAVLIVSGLVHGFWTDRFRPSPETQQAVERMARLPLDIGEWKGEELEVKPGQAGAGVAGCLQRRDVHARTGKWVAVALVCGRPGPVSIHSPNVCYAASGYTVNRPRRVEVAGAPFWTSDATLTKAAEEKRARIYWAWNSGPGWKAADDAREEFIGAGVLYKLYVLRELDGPEEGLKEEPCEQFMQLLLPKLNETLFVTDS